jgi:PST family polysaccharide transporter
MITSFFMAKVIAVKLGPEGLGIIGQLNSFVLIIMTLSTGAITNGVVKFIAEYNNDKEKQKKVINAALSITLFCTLLISIVVGLGAKYWSAFIFNGQTSFSGVFVVFGFTIVFYSSFTLYTSVLNGFQQYQKFNTINIVTSIVGLLFSLVLINYFGISGALYATVTYQSVVFFVILAHNKKNGWFNIKELFDLRDLSVYKSLIGFSVMSLVSTICVPYVQILIRKYINDVSGPIQMGFYEGITRISILYLTVITTTLSVYYLPRLSELKGKNELKSEIRNGYKIIIPSLLVFVLIIFMLKNVIIKLAFSSSFNAMSDYFLPQLIGDVFKISSWLLAFLMLAKAMTRLFIITEIIFSISLYVMTILLVDKYGAIGAIYAYDLNFFIYLLLMVYLFRKTIF